MSEKRVPHTPGGAARSVDAPGGRRRKSGPEYEYRVITVPRSTPRTAMTQYLTEEAEYGHWELARVVLFMGGTRKVTLRRKILRVQRTA